MNMKQMSSWEMKTLHFGKQIKSCRDAVQNKTSLQLLNITMNLNGLPLYVMAPTFLKAWAWCRYRIFYWMAVTWGYTFPLLSVLSLSLLPGLWFSVYPRPYFEVFWGMAHWPPPLPHLHPPFSRGPLAGQYHLQPFELLHCLEHSAKNNNTFIVMVRRVYHYISYKIVSNRHLVIYGHCDTAVWYSNSNHFCLTPNDQN